MRCGTNYIIFHSNLIFVFEGMTFDIYSCQNIRVHSHMSSLKVISLHVKTEATPGAELTTLVYSDSCPEVRRSHESLGLGIFFNIVIPTV